MDGIQWINTLQTDAQILFDENIAQHVISPVRFSLKHDRFLKFMFWILSLRMFFYHYSTKMGANTVLH